MEKIIFKVTALAVVFLMAACSADEVVNQVNDENRQVSTKAFTAEAIIAGGEVSVKSSQTRVSLNKETNTVKVTWNPGDVIELCLVQGAKISEIQEVTLTAADIFDSGKKARFGFDLPPDFDTGESATFTLYGVHGGGGLQVVDNSPRAILPESGRISLQEVEDNNDMVLYFSAEDISVTNPGVLVNFNHLGSLYNIVLGNKSNASLDLESVKLVAIEGETGWTYSAGSFDLVSETITGTSTDEIAFDVPSGTTVPAGESVTLFRWLPVQPANVDWPELALTVNSKSTIEITPPVTTWNSSIQDPYKKKARTATAGKNNILHAQWSGDRMVFGFVANPGFEAATGGAVPEGWTLTKSPANAPTWTFGAATNGMSRYRFHFGNNEGPSTFDSSLSQQLRNLPDGTYRLEVWAYMITDFTDFDPMPYLFARGYGGEEKKAFVDEKNVGAESTNRPYWQKYEINDIEVTNGACEIGVRAVADGQARLYIDDFNFVKVN